MSLKMRDLPKITVSILFCHNKRWDVVEALRIWVMCEDSNVEQELKVELIKALNDCYDNPKNRYKVCKILLPKLNAKLRKLQNEGMYIVALTYDETPLDDVNMDAPSEEAKGFYETLAEGLTETRNFLEEQKVSITEIENPEISEAHNIE